MIKINVVFKNNKFKSLEVKGHANSAEYGKDLICASVSSVLTGGFNSIYDEKNFEFKLEEGYARLEAKSDYSELDEGVIHTILTSLKTIALSSKNYVSINEIRKEE